MDRVSLIHALPMTIQFGVDVFLRQVAQYDSYRLALVTNQAATTAAYYPSRLALLKAGFQLTTLFSPEHGLETIGEDGKPVLNGTDALTGLPIISLYGDKLRPTATDLLDIDAVIVDLPDVGCRFYTYLWTLTHVMEACARYQKPVVLLDRPNPLSGLMHTVEGPMLQEDPCASFIGRWAVPVRHSCTFGELATYWQQHRLPTLALTVIRATGWRREQFVWDWQPSFIPTSPAIVSAEAVLLYPGLGLLEATNLSEGRGTAMPFRVVGAPWLTMNELASQLNALSLPGVVGRAIVFVPQTGKYNGQYCQGISLHVLEPARFKSVVTGMLLIKLIYDRYPAHFSWETYPTHVNPTGANHLDKLLGIPDAEALFEQPMPVFRERLDELVPCETWAHTIQPYLLY